LRFAIAAFRAAVSRLPALAGEGMSIDIVSELSGPGGAKIGLGSSAAVTVGVVAAMFAAGGCEPLDVACRAAMFATALDAHRVAQGGLGSGIDVAASLHGGLCFFEPRGAAAPRVTSLHLPADITLLAAWSGAAASTARLVQRYRATVNGSAVPRAAFVAASRACVDAFVAALARGSLSLRAVDDGGNALEQLGRDLALPLVTRRLRQLVTIARAAGAAAKISGAGGGDCGIALTRDRAAADRIRSAWHAVGIIPLDLRISRQGVTVAHT
jgi:phosphomevalonate kinase